MGCGASALSSPPERLNSSLSDGSNESSASIVKWKIFMSHDEALKRFQADGTILDASCDPEYLDLRTLLDDPAAQSAIGKFASSIKVLDVFMCWIDIQEYKAIPTDTYRRSKALHIFQKYIKAGAVLDINLMTPGEVQSLHNKIEKSRGDASVLNKEMYNKLQYRCFESIYSRIYQPFKQTVAFQSLTNDLRFKYNRVKLSHFEYFGKLGEGGFGFVVHCKKKSTGKHYAMKIQTKKGLLHTFRENPLRANMEKDILASCQHPFIGRLEYSFQTESLAIMVLSLATGGDLNECMLQTRDIHYLGEERVRFYAAEIVLALAYLHQSGLIYRDLKPQNVLLAEDGHVQLVDLGGVMETHIVQEQRLQNEAQAAAYRALVLASQNYEGDQQQLQQQKQQQQQQGVQSKRVPVLTPVNPYLHGLTSLRKEKQCYSQSDQISEAESSTGLNALQQLDAGSDDDGEEFNPLHRDRHGHKGQQQQQVSETAIARTCSHSQRPDLSLSNHHPDKDSYRDDDSHNNDADDDHNYDDCGAGADACNKSLVSEPCSLEAIPTEPIDSKLHVTDCTADSRAVGKADHDDGRDHDKRNKNVETDAAAKLDSKTTDCKYELKSGEKDGFLVLQQRADLGAKEAERLSIPADTDPATGRISAQDPAGGGGGGSSSSSGPISYEAVGDRLADRQTAEAGRGAGRKSQQGYGENRPQGPARVPSDSLDPALLPPPLAILSAADLSSPDYGPSYPRKPSTVVEQSAASSSFVSDLCPSPAAHAAQARALDSGKSNAPTPFIPLSGRHADFVNEICQADAVGNSPSSLADSSKIKLRSRSNSNHAVLPSQQQQQQKRKTSGSILSRSGKGSSPGAVTPVGGVTAPPASTPLSQPRRKFSIMGTLGYMAPEMILMMNHRRSKPPNNTAFQLELGGSGPATANAAAAVGATGQVTTPHAAQIKDFPLSKKAQKRGYSNEVDWWALGITMYKLLTGTRPFAALSYGPVYASDPSMLALLKENLGFIDYAKLFQKVEYPDHVSAEARDVINRFLDVNTRTRLGAGRKGLKAIKTHPFFAGIDWEALEQRRVDPPYKPEAVNLDGFDVSYPDLTTLLSVNGRGFWMEDAPPPEQQVYFANWNFTAPSALRVEAGLAQVMEQYDRNLKVQKIIGSPMAHQMKRHPNGRKNRRRRGGEDDDDDGGGKVGNNFFKSLAYGRVGSDDEQEVVGGRGMGGSLRPAEPTQNKKKTSLIKLLKV